MGATSLDEAPKLLSTSNLISYTSTPFRRFEGDLILLPGRAETEVEVRLLLWPGPIPILDPDIPVLRHFGTNPWVRFSHRVPFRMAERAAGDTPRLDQGVLVALQPKFWVAGRRHCPFGANSVPV